MAGDQDISCAINLNNMDAKLSTLTENKVINKIHVMRHQKVMLDRDLADLYGVKATRLREQVKRNIVSFPLHFMFQLNQEETEIMVSQNAIPSKKQLGGALPYVFTEHGVLMLANVLKSQLATQVSIKLIEVFVKLRETLNTNTEIKEEIDAIKRKLHNQDQNIELVFQYLDELMVKKEITSDRNPIGFIK